MKHSHFIEFLSLRLQQPLPGWDSHKKMSPLINGTIPFGYTTIPHDAKKSAAAILLYPRSDASELLLTLRSQKVSHHKGQISLPGGRSEENEHSIETALRETHEEIGIDPSCINVIGALSPLYVPPSQSLMNIIVGELHAHHEFSINPDEVQEVFSISLDTLLNTDITFHSKQRSNGIEVIAPVWEIHPTTHLWGATAMILNELLWLYKEFKEHFYE
jgi:8-oxo-dGTP pyrophosphatase MutT (NUDIX family)